MIRVLLAEDQLMFRTAVRRLLELEGDIRVVAEVGRGDELLGVGASLLSALLYAIGTIYARDVLHSTAALPLVIGQELVAGIVVLPLAWLALPASTLSPSVNWATLTLALVMTAGGNLLYFRLITHVGPTAAQSVSFLVPAFALLAGVLVLREPFTVGMLLGLMVIALSIVLVTDVYVHLQLPVRATFASATTAVAGRMHRRYVAPSRQLAWSGREAAMPGTPRSFGADDVPVYDRHTTRVRPVHGQPVTC